MATTIAVQDDTMDMLKIMKVETNSGTFDETIKKVIVRSKKVDVNKYFGMMKTKEKFVRDPKDRLYKK